MLQLLNDPDGAARLQAILNQTTATGTNALEQHYATMRKIAERKLREQQREAQVHVGVPRGASYTGGSALPGIPQGNVRDWIRQALTVSGHRGEHLGRGLYQMIMHESGGNPNAKNGWDSNAAAGTPSIGLMQTIQPTFDAYAMKGYGNIYDPIANIIAGLRYALSRYGPDMVRSGGRHDANGNYLGY